MIYLDTHVVAWLYAGRMDLVPTGVKDILNANTLLISPAVKLELQYLFEIGRTTDPADHVVDTLARQIGLEI